VESSPYGDDRLALFIGDDDRYASVGAHSWEVFCQDCGFGVKPTLSLLGKFAHQVIMAWAKVIQQTTHDFELTKPELALMKSITQVV
jgi:serine/threonine-protein kinase HipA